MTTVVDPDWWKTLFDEIYLITDARSVCDDVLTCREVDMICEPLPLNPGHKILDLCGGHGGHTLERRKRGYTNCTLFDYAKKLIDVAQTKANEYDYCINVLHGDARSTDLPGSSSDQVCGKHRTRPN
jgi:D-alanine-D-alanine ligase